MTTTTTYPTDDQIGLVRLRHQLTQLVEDVERTSQRFEVIDDATAAALGSTYDELRAALRRLEALDHLSDDGSAGSGVIH